MVLFASFDHIPTSNLCLFDTVKSIFDLPALFSSDPVAAGHPLKIIFNKVRTIDIAWQKK